MFAPRPAARHLVLPGPAGAVLGLPAGAAAALVTWTLGGGAVTGLILSAITAGWLAALTTPAGAMVAALQAWACYDGFVVHRYGALGTSRTDLVALAVVAGAALVVHAVAHVARRPTPAALPGYPPPELSRIGAAVE